ncbi:MAG: hypothetical protein NT075_13020 [Chloroflexi bacterium]|nr:hypothetical protein [Chloroflexota bacterium]
MNKEQMIKLLVLLQLYYESHPDVQSQATEVHMAVFQSVVQEFNEKPVDVYLATMKEKQALRRE